MNKQTVICVLGMHRSGTSLLTRILNLIGMNLGPADMLTTEPVADNPKGYWEHSGLTLVSDAIIKRHGGSWNNPPALPPNWETDAAIDDLKRRALQIVTDQFGDEALWGWKDPRTCLTLPFWQRLLPDIRYVICLRNPIAVARSLSRRDHLSPEESSRLWLSYVAPALHYTDGKRRLFVFYEDLMDNCLEELPRLAQFLDVPEQANATAVQNAVLEFVEPGLEHFRADTTRKEAPTRTETRASAHYTALRVVEQFSRIAIKEPGDLDSNLRNALDILSQYSLEAADYF